MQPCPGVPLGWDPGTSGAAGPHPSSTSLSTPAPGSSPRWSPGTGDCAASPRWLAGRWDWWGASTPYVFPVLLQQGLEPGMGADGIEKRIELQCVDAYG